MKGISSAIAALAAFLAVSGAAATPPPSASDAAATKSPAAAAPEHAVYFAPKDAVWTDAPPSLPKGAKVMVLRGNPAAPGPFTMRVLLPAGYRLPPHWHPAEENVTVISGTFNHAPGETWDDSKGHAMGPGSFMSTPARARHFAWTREETVIQVHAVGPWGIEYVNPGDDPRQSKQAVP